MSRQKLILLILDGWGIREDKDNNAIAISGAPNFYKLLSSYPHTKLNASEEDVGLPAGQMGNSEVGHTNIGAGRIVYQDFLKITKSIDSGEIRNNENINKFFDSVKDADGSVHFFGLLSDGGVHSHIKHLKGLISFAKDSGVKNTYIHAFMDGRDTPPRSGQGYMEELVSFMKEINYGEVATVAGRYYPMDRDQRWDRTKLAYDAIRNGIGLSVDSAVEAVTAGYARGENDEFIKPTVIKGADGSVKDGDGVFFFNFRADRARQLTKAFTMPDFDGFDRGSLPDIDFMTMTFYESSFTAPMAFQPQVLTNILGEVLSKNGLKQLRIAETEKYAHVTYFFNGGEEKVFEGEHRALVESPKEVATYDEKPSMSIYKVIERFREEIGSVDVAIMNFANPDMVGHTGILDAAVSACKAVDECLGEVIRLADEHNAILAVTADHGNAEQMWDYENNQPHTAHTLNPVPFIIYNFNCELTEKTGKLADIAPTMLELLGIEQPAEMTGTSLLKK
ncbi:phosphoglycerate mutase, 2,3-bisphosphoglycerate- independent [Denitrovibrio acetiphilus DSM 12809]|uniref:2,3-bisphosphoglycerate-independent phosphoglycerate mutase n=1 Tax=Denitrovibrio acetiphilus (strain DSM 12809 / NBRC 114555 / N2460) TaxID=522772 RepID=D4H6J6_DENA2|nr:2,3-bisphosphoglycerate-independent phosphoglycerate mutase [Denitrovibrio acetiphilus]ADD69670.1 phosphoglycerate mutase, 2,3-bisphosphoglycerate- independent [Denitrovibrio acetiphilus DSM 12809]